MAECSGAAARNVRVRREGGGGGGRGRVRGGGGRAVVGRVGGGEFFLKKTWTAGLITNILNGLFAKKPRSGLDQPPATDRTVRVGRLLR